MSELAFNLKGEPFELSPLMAAWRLMRMKPKGAPDPVYGRDGSVSFLPPDADVDDVRTETQHQEGRYRLDQVDAQFHSIAGAQSGYVYVHAVERQAEKVAPVARVAADASATTELLVNALTTAMKEHTEMARLYVSQFPVLVNSVFGLVSSSGGLQPPIPPPPSPPPAPVVTPPEGGSDAETEEEDDESEEEIEIEVVKQPEHSWLRLLQTFADHAAPHAGPVIGALAGKLAEMAGLTGDPGSAAPAPTAGSANTTAAETAARSDAPSIDLATGLHLRAILKALPPEDAALAQLMAEELPPDQRTTWIEKLRPMSVTEGVAYVRAQLAEVRGASAARQHAAEAPRQARGPSAPPHNTPAAAPTTAPAAPADAAPSPTVPSAGLSLFDTDSQRQLAAIESALTIDERAALRASLAAQSPADRAGWLSLMMVLPVADAVSAVRAELAGPRNHAQPAETSAHIAEPRTAGGEPARNRAAAMSPTAPIPAGVAEPAPREAASTAARSTSPLGVATPVADAAAIRDPATIERERRLADDDDQAHDDQAHDDQAHGDDPGADDDHAHDNQPHREAPPEKPTPQAIPPGTRHADPASGPIIAPVAAPSRKPPAPPENPMPQATPPRTSPTSTASGPTSAPAPVPAPSMKTPIYDGKALVHLQAIDSALSPQEQKRARTLADRLPVAEVHAWFAMLLSLSVPDAVARIRATLDAMERNLSSASKGGVR